MRNQVALALFALSICWPSIATASERPNILIAIADDWSFGHAGAYGCQWVSTPNFDRIAREGVLFTRAFTPNAKCAPSRATILTGRYSWQLEQAGNHMCIFPAKFGGFIERLVADGYVAGYTGKGWGPGIANDASGKPRQITGKNFSSKKAKPPTRAISNNDYAGNFGDFLASTRDDQPWVFWYGTTEPHRGYEFGSGVRLGKKLGDVDRVPAYWPDTDTIRHDMLDYAIEVEHYDTHLGRIIAQLERAGELDNTLIVATSDHGMPFPRVKGQAYAHSNHIPLAIRWGAQIKNAGRQSELFVNFTDLAPTFLEAAGVSDPGTIMQPLSGHSLLDILADEPDEQLAEQRGGVLVGKERHDIGRPEDAGYPIRGIRKGDWLLIKNFETARWPAGNPETGYLNCDGSPTKSAILDLRRNVGSSTFWDLAFGRRPGVELYNVAEDPDCVVNLADDPQRAELLQSLADEMESTLKEQGDPRMFGNGRVFDRYPYSSPATENFYSRYTAGEKLKAGWVSETDFEAGPVDQ